MKTLVIFNTETGSVISTMTGNIQDNTGCMVVEIADNMRVVSVDVNTGEVNTQPAALSETQRLEAMEKLVAEKMVSENDGTTEKPIPFVYGMPVVNNLYYEYNEELYCWIDNDNPACVWLPDTGIWQWEKVV